jgi:hypothetical protein
MGMCKRITLLVLALVLLYGSIMSWMAYQLYWSLYPTVTPLSISGLCAESWSVRGKIELPNKSPAHASVVIASCVISDLDMHEAFTVTSTDLMSFPRRATTTQEADASVSVINPEWAGHIMTALATEGVVEVHVDVKMHVSMTMLPFTVPVPYRATHQFSMGGGADAKPCSTCSTVKNKAVEKFEIVRNDEDEMTVQMNTFMSWYIPWSFDAHFPATNWELFNEKTGNPIAVLDVNATELAAAETVSMSMTSTVRRAYAEAARDAFTRSMDYGELAISMRGSGESMASCPSFRELIRHFSYPVYSCKGAADPACNSTTSPAKNPITGALMPRSTFLTDISNVTLISATSTAATMTAIVNLTTSEGITDVSQTMQRTALLSNTMPDIAIDVCEGAARVMTMLLRFDGCYLPSPRPQSAGLDPPSCNHSGVTMSVTPLGTSAISTIVLADIMNEKSTAFDLKARVATDKANSSVLSIIWSNYSRHVEANFSGSNGTTSKLDGISGSVNDDTVDIELSPQFPASIFLNGPYNDAVQAMLSEHRLALTLGHIRADVVCTVEDGVVANMTAIVDGNHEHRFDVAGTLDVKNFTASRCFSPPEGSPEIKNATLPPFRVSVRMGSDHDPFIFQSAYALQADGSDDIELGAGLAAPDICHNLVDFGIEFPAPSVLTLFGDVDVTVDRGTMTYAKGVAATVSNTTSRGPHLQIRGSNARVAFDANITHPTLPGAMLNTWYSTWYDLDFGLDAHLSIQSAASNPVQFQHTFDLTHNFNCVNGATLTTDTFTDFAIVASDDEVATLKFGMQLNLTRSVADGWGFPPFDVDIPNLNWNLYSNDTVVATVSTSTFHGQHDTLLMGPVEFVCTVTDAHTAKFTEFTRRAVAFELGCTNETVDLVMVGDGQDPDHCLFQEGIAAVKYPLLPGYANNTKQNHTFEVDKVAVVQSTSDRMTAGVFLSNTSDASIMNMVPGIPGFNLSLYTSFAGVDMPRQRVLSAALETKKVEENGVAALLQIDRAGVASLIDQLWHALVGGFASRFYVAVDPLGAASQKVFTSVLHGASQALNECLEPETAVGTSFTAAPSKLPFDIRVLESNAQYLVLQLVVHLNMSSSGIAAEALAHTRFIFGEVGVDLHTGNAAGKPVLPAVLSGRLASVSTDQIAMNLNISTDSGINSILASILAKTDPRLLAVVRVHDTTSVASGAFVAIADLPIAVPDLTSCDNSTAGGGGGGGGGEQCPPGWKPLFEGVCLKINLLPPSVALRAAVKNPLPIAFALSDLHCELYAKPASSDQKFQPGVIATGGLAQTSVTIPANGAANISIDLSPTNFLISNIRPLFMAYSGNQLALSLRKATAKLHVANWATTVSFDDPSELALPTDCSDSGAYFEKCLAATGSACGTFKPCFSPLTGGSHGSKVQCVGGKCVCDAGYCLAGADKKGSCTRDLGRIPPAACPAVVGSCRYQGCPAGSGSTCGAAPAFACSCPPGECANDGFHCEKQHTER